MLEWKHNCTCYCDMPFCNEIFIFSNEILFFSNSYYNRYFPDVELRNIGWGVFLKAGQGEGQIWIVCQNCMNEIGGSNV